MGLIGAKERSDGMSPSKYCNVVQCTDCKHYTECLERKAEQDESKGRFLEELRFVEINEE